MSAIDLPRISRRTFLEGAAVTVAFALFPDLESKAGQPVEKLPAAGIRQCLEHIVHGDNMQPFGCLSTPMSATRGKPSRVLMRSDEDLSALAPQATEGRIARAAVPIGTHQGIV